MTRKIAAIHDLSGYGRASLTVVIPVLSYMGCQVCPLPTAVLSAHSEYRNFRCFDLTAQMQPVIDHWKEMDLHFDALYSGYLASVEQMDIVRNFFRDFGTGKNLIVVDPVLGDGCSLYPGMNPEMVDRMRELCRQARVITPNLTEAAFLLGRDGKAGWQEAASWCRELSGLGPEYCIITSVPSRESGLVSTLAYSRREDRLWEISTPHVPADYPGTGDAFASAVTGSLLGGSSLPEAVARAVHFISMGIAATYGSGQDPLDGMNQEEVLHCLTDPLPENGCKEIRL